MIWYWRITASIAGWEDENSAKDYAEIKPYTPAWGEQITGVPRQYIESIAREFADTAHKTHGRSMIILGAGVNHWYHMDMNYRGMINMLIFCGCVGQSGGGWAHYVGQEKLRPQTAGCHWPLRSTGTDHRAK
ncbi:respiratory nitrate reductase 2 alpha chain [Escherichia coli]|uniref:Respiratory nitrate reductase 2 alpha chain n=1 Tax=Escherichia coli TaxID=562 RepID=A0A376TH58_ECOLX|nr:respiratory nitrate reductase 2 alpha chain [Escherichia coli]